MREGEPGWPLDRLPLPALEPVPQDPFVPPSDAVEYLAELRRHRRSLCNAAAAIRPGDPALMGYGPAVLEINRAIERGDALLLQMANAHYWTQPVIFARLATPPARVSKGASPLETE